jgi:hypothetical protein
MSFGGEEMSDTIEREHMSDETKKYDIPGMMEVAKGVRKQDFPHTVDAMEWAKEFHKHGFRVWQEPGGVVEDQVGLMVGWFANAIMAGYDTAMMRIKNRRRK